MGIVYWLHAVLFGDYLGFDFDLRFLEFTTIRLRVTSVLVGFCILFIFFAVVYLSYMCALLSMSLAYVEICY